MFYLFFWIQNLYKSCWGSHPSVPTVPVILAFPQVEGEARQPPKVFLSNSSLTFLMVGTVKAQDGHILCGNRITLWSFKQISLGWNLTPQEERLNWVQTRSRHFLSSFSNFWHSQEKKGKSAKSAAGLAMRMAHFLKSCPKGSNGKFYLSFILIGRSA